MSEAQWVPRMVGRTPWSARVPLDPLPGSEISFVRPAQADGGVGCGPGGPPHHQCTLPGSAKAKAYATLACLTLLAIRAVAADVALPFRYTYLVEDVAAFAPAHPDSPDAWNLPASPRFSNRPPRGN